MIYLHSFFSDGFILTDHRDVKFQVLLLLQLLLIGGIVVVVVVVVDVVIITH